MSTHERPRPDELAPDLVANLRLEVREAYRPGRWMWELIDVRDGTPFERQFEFDSAGDARQSGLGRLAELTPSLPGAKMIATTADSQLTNRLVVVSRDHIALYADLQRLFANNRHVEVICDRRRFDRRRGDRRMTVGVPSSVRSVERRTIDRRGRERRSRRVDPSFQARGWWVVPRSGAHVTTSDQVSA